ncbi:hypothetical protein [Desulfolithobacter sp.]
MSQILPLLFLLIFVVLIVGSFIILIRSLREDKGLFLHSWRRMTSFERNELQIGLILYAVLPLFKEHPANGSYIAKIFIDIFTALAGALFTMGALTFLKHLHEVSKERQIKPNT